MAIVFALLSAATYGVSDFAAGFVSRRMAVGIVATTAQVIGFLTSLVAILLFPGTGPHAGALAWGALSGVGSAVGTLALYRGLATAPMSVVATLSGVLTAVIPVLVGIALGNHLGAVALVGIVLAVPSIALVSTAPADPAAGSARAGVLPGALSGAGFALLFIALDRAGTHAGAWPIVPGQLVSVVLLAPIALRGRRSGLRRGGDRDRGQDPGGHRRPTPRTIAIMLVVGILSGTANLLYLAATGRGQLAIVAVLSALYPAVTVLMARVLLSERWNRRQIAGLLAAAVAVVLVTLG